MPSTKGSAELEKVNGIKIDATKQNFVAPCQVDEVLG